MNESSCYTTLALLAENSNGNLFNVIGLIAIFAVGVVGNGSILWLFLREKKLRDVNNAFIVNLAVSDLLLLIIYVPSVIFENYYYFRPFGITFCRVLTLFTYCSHDVSILSLVVLSYIRYRAVMYPMENYTKRRTAWTILGCSAIWAISMSVAIVPMLNCAEICLDDIIMVHIVEMSEVAQLYHYIRFGMFYVIPLVFIGCVYSVMAKKLISGGTLLKRSNSTSARKAIQSRHRLGVIVLTLIIVFALSWMPRYIQVFLGQFSIRSLFLNRLTKACITLGSSLNPIVLYAASTMFRTYFVRDILVCLPKDQVLAARFMTMTSVKHSSRYGPGVAEMPNKPVSQRNTTSFAEEQSLKENNNIV